MKKLLLLPLLILSGCTKMTCVPYTEHNVLAEGETLHIYLYEPIVEVDHIIVEYDEINWYDIVLDYFVLDYKADPGRWYIPMDSIAMWGIER